VTGGDAIVTLEDDSAEAFVPALLELLAADEVWRASSDRARARGMELLWPTQGEKLLAAYRELGEAGVGSGVRAARQGV
jgi:hypothetical protein